MKRAWPWLIRSARAIMDIMPAEQRKAVSSILLLETLGVKDAVAATPAIDALLTTFPGAKIILAATPASCQMLRHDNRVSETIPVAAPWVFSTANRKAFAASVAKLCAKTYDIAIDLDNNPGNRLMLGLVSSPVRVGHVGQNDFTLTHKVAAPPTEMSIADRKLELAIKSGAKMVHSLPSLRLTYSDQRYIQDLLNGLNLSNKFLVAISADAADVKCRWPDNYFSELGDRIREIRPDAEVLFFGAPGDSAKLDQLTKQMANRPSTLLLSLPRLAAFLERCDLYFGLHSGPSYIAGAIGVRSILLYPHQEFFTAPVGPNIRVLAPHNDLAEVKPAFAAEAIVRAIDELPAKAPEMRGEPLIAKAQNLYFHAVQEVTEPNR
ncbi:MAG TPA: glycosyltransferase family 9 protein [bacterium]|nr:glycosyltransferase family 9 protein [bacterium]